MAAFIPKIQSSISCLF